MRFHWPSGLLTSAALLPIGSISVTVNQAIRLITVCARRATGNYRNQNRLETATHWNDRDGYREQKSLQWWLMVGSPWISLSTNNMNHSATYLTFTDYTVGLLSADYNFVVRKEWSAKTKKVNVTHYCQQQHLFSPFSFFFFLELWLKTWWHQTWQRRSSEQSQLSNKDMLSVHTLMTVQTQPGSQCPENEWQPGKQ